MPNWVRPETFAEIGAPQEYANAYAKPLDRTAIHNQLGTTRPDLLSYFRSGGELLHQANSSGELELFVLTDTPGDWHDVPWGIQVDEASGHRLIVELVIHDHPENPLLMPFIFALEHVEARYDAVALCEQPSLPVFVVTWERGQLVQAYCRELVLPADARFQLTNAVRKACGLPPLAERGEASLPSLEELSQIGSAYEFTLDSLRPLLRQANSLVLPEIRSALESLSEHRNSGLRAGPFILWVSRNRLLDDSNQWAEGLTYIITPLYERRARGRRTDLDPLLGRFQAIPGFIRTEHAFPLREGAIPLLRFANGATEEVSPTPELVKHLASTYVDVASRSPFDWPRSDYQEATFLERYASLLASDQPQSRSPHQILAEMRSLRGAAKRWVYGFYQDLLAIDLDSPLLIGIEPSKIRVGADRHEEVIQRVRAPMGPEQRLALEIFYVPHMDPDLPSHQIVLDEGALEISKGGPSSAKRRVEPVGTATHVLARSHRGSSRAKAKSTATMRQKSKGRSSASAKARTTGKETGKSRASQIEGKKSSAAKPLGKARNRISRSGVLGRKGK